jgi:hypothetical protein
MRLFAAIGSPGLLALLEFGETKFLSGDKGRNPCPFLLGHFPRKNSEIYAFRLTYESHAFQSLKYFETRFLAARVSRMSLVSNRRLAPKECK